MESVPPALNRAAPAALDLILSRRSGSAKAMTAPGPNASQVNDLLTAAGRSPDHGKLFPWRFILFEGEARGRMGQLLVECLTDFEPQASQERIEMERGRFLRAPIVIAVVSRVREAIAIPEWEQILSAGAACQNLLLAAHAMGFVANWITEWPAYNPKVKERLGLKSGDRIAGFVYVGTAATALEERARPDLSRIVSRF